MLFLSLVIFYYRLIAYINAEFYETKEVFEISEDAPVGTRVGRVSLTPGFTYRVSGVNNYFDFNAAGWITLRTALDRERTNGSVDLLLVSTLASIIHVVINVLDINDNAPEFPVPFQNVSIVESNAIGTRIHLLPATDRDAGLNGTVVDYRIENPVDEFDLIYDGSGLLYLEVRQALDRESKQLVVMNISARDGGVPARTSYTTIYVKILDVNDNAPTFYSREIEAKWNGFAASPIFTLNATDADHGRNGDIVYSIPGVERTHFRIEGSQVFAQKDNPPCCASPPCSECFISIKATDRGIPPLESTALLKVLLTTENLHDPLITIRLHPSTVDFALIETGALAGKAVAVLTVTDEDGPLLDSSPISIESGNEDNVFDLIVQKQFSILKLAKNAESIDRSEFDLHFLAKDGQTPPRVTRRLLKVYNEAKLTASPVMVEKNLAVSLPENSPVGSFVTQVHTNSSECRFSLSDTSPFHVDGLSGIITTTSNFDINNASSYTLEVTVQLPPPSIQPIMSTVTVTITDVNDHAPKFVDLPDRLSISEDTRVGSTVLIVKAVDKDRGENARISYRLTDILGSNYLSIDNRSGKLTLKKALDFEDLQQFEAEIEACDHGEPNLCSTVYLPINVLDTNDNSPDFPCPATHAVLPLNSPPGTVVATVSAKDLDSGVAGRVHYALLDAITGFSIDRTTGEIRTTENLQDRVYKIRIGAMDGNGIMSTNNATVTLYTTNSTILQWSEGPDTIDVNGTARVGKILATYKTTSPSSIKIISRFLSIDTQGRLTVASSLPIDMDHLHAVLIAESTNTAISKCIHIRVKRDPPPPVFPKKAITMKLARDAPLGMEILKVDPGAKSELKTDCRWLRVDSSGVLSIKELIDKSIDGVQCAVEAQDSKGAKDTVNLLLTMKTSEEPLQLNASYSLHVKEGTRPGAVLTTLSTDSNYVFKAKFDTSVGVFPDGTVYVKKAITRTAANVITVPITATHMVHDNTYSALVHVFVDDVNDHAPKCSEQSHFSVKENMGIGITVGFLNATDEDPGLNGVLGYRLLDSQDLLHIGVATGKITTATVFYAESLRKVDFKYEVFDHGSPQNTAICNATVVIVDVNDNSPAFEQLFYTVNVNVNSLTDSRSITAVKAVDKDINDKITYRMLNYHHLFEINQTSGEVLRKGRLRGDARYNISIAAEDHDKKRAETFLIVTTGPDNDLYPVFDKMMEPLSISSIASIGSLVGKLRATAGSHVIKYHISDHRFDVDTWGNVILTAPVGDSPSQDIVVTASTPYRNATALMKVLITSDADELKSEGTFWVEENTVTSMITELGDDYKVLLTVPRTSAFAVRDRKLVLVSPLDRENSSSYKVLVGNNRITRLLTIEVQDVNDNDPDCDVNTFLAHTAPLTIPLKCTDPDTGLSNLSYRVTSSDATVTSDGRLTLPSLKEPVTSVYVEVSDGKNETTRRTKTILVHVIRANTRDAGISFPSKEISMLMTSSQPIGTKLGRITAESALPVKYYVTGSSLIRVNEDTGVISTRRAATKDETVVVLAVSSKGMASVRVNIELIEDQLILPRKEFLFVPSSLISVHSLGKIDVGRDDVSMDLSDPYFYIRGADLFSKKPLDFKGAPYYNCTAHVWKGRVSAEIEIYVLPPSTETTRPDGSYKLEFWVRENAPYGSVVGQVPATNEGKAVSYSVIGNSGLSIDSKTGILKTAMLFDHETQQIYNFKLRTTLVSGEMLHRDAILFVDDENDNIPKFEREIYEVEISEDVDVGVEILQLRWSDKDFNNALHPSIIEGNEFGQFDVDYEGRIKVSFDFSNLGQVSRPLDREQINEHRLTVQLSDGIAPYPYHTTECTVIVRLTDVNDNAPEFVSPSEFLVEENSPRTKSIGRVKAIDADEGRNAQISYRILPETLPFAEFVIDAVHRDIMVNKPLDFEKRQNYTFTVVAMDYGSPQMQTEQQITVHIVDVNDHNPVINTSKEIVNVDEVVPRGSTIATFNVVDEDTVENSASVFALEDGYGIFDVSPISGQLFLTTPLDFEARSEYNLTVSARNIAGGAKTYKSITIQVMDKNDEAPRFVSGSPVQFSVYENLPGPYPAKTGSTISDDLDEGENGLVAYSIFSGNTSLFSINSATGDLLVLAPLDREEHNEHFLAVQAIDSGSPRHSATTEIKITVLDDNDNAPEFDQPYYIVHVRENSKIGGRVMQVKAVDKDEGVNGAIRYALLGESPFVINKLTGVISIAGDLDREVSDRYQIGIRATDSGKYKQHTSIANLTILIDDVNDNNPVIRNKLLDIFVPNNLKKSDVVHVVDAVDNDEDSRLFYNISGPDARFFAINEHGEIVAKTSLENKAYYSITVAVFDMGGLNTSASFTFYIDHHQKFPRWTSTLNNTKINENTIGEVFRFQAESPGNESNHITYSVLSANDGSFVIDPVTGRLSIRSELDRERRSIYRLWIAATDSNTPPKSSITLMIVKVEDVNDNNPMFAKVIYTAEIQENIEPQKILCVSASDTDLGENAKISYAISEGNSKEAFTIDFSTGCIRTSHSLDREAVSEYRLIVKATDGGKPPLSAEAIVKVKVLDEDDNAPKFSHLFHAQVREDLEIGAPILLISANDPDEFVNHTFSIDDEGLTQFTIDKYTGQISLRQKLDREKESSYRLRVRVSDGTWAVQTGAAITVLDVNDNAPVFEKDRYVFIVNRSQINHSIGKVQAIDADEGLNGVVHYHFEKDIRCLSIDVITGDLRLLCEPHRDIITVIVIAQDNGMQGMTSTTMVTVVFPAGGKTVCEIPVNVGTTNGTRLGSLEQYCNDDVNEKISQTSRQFLSEDSHVVVDLEGNLIATRDYNNGEDITTRLISEMADGTAMITKLKLRISQGNNHLPHFEEKIIRFAVSEDLDDGDVVGVVNANDSDVGLAGKLRYRIQSDSEVPLRVLPNGTLVVVGALDYEAKKRYVFNVTAMDRGQPPRNASAQVVVDLLDVNDNPPVVEDKELTYAIISPNDVICPTVFDIDTPVVDLDFFTDNPNVTTSAQHGCIKFNHTVPPTINWTVSDENQSITVKLNLLDMIPKQPELSDMNVTISENSGDGTMVTSYGNVIFAEQNDQLSVESKDVKVKGGHGLREDVLRVYAKSRFGWRNLRSSNLTLTTTRDAPSPLFEKEDYAFNVSKTTPVDTVIHDFRLHLPDNCHIEIVPGNEAENFCLSKDAALIVCGRLRKLHYSILMEIICANRITSRTSLSITVSPASVDHAPAIGFVREGAPSAVIGQLRDKDDQSRKAIYHIGDKHLREIFALSSDGTLSTLKPLDRSIRSVYRIPVVVQPPGARPSTRTFVVFVDEDAETTTTRPKINATALLADPVTEFDLSDLNAVSAPTCQAINNDRYEVSADCRITIEQSVDNYETINASINNRTLEVTLKALRIQHEFASSMLQLAFYALPNGVAQMLTELQRTYSDLTFYPLAIDTSTYRNTLSLAIVDRNHKVISANDSRDIVARFFKMDEFAHALLESIETNLCANVFCAINGTCRQKVLWKRKSSTFTGPESIWSIPEGAGAARCRCTAGFTGERCEDVKKCDRASCPDGECTVDGDCVRDCEKTCKNGICTNGVCDCLLGYAGMDCSLRTYGTATEQKRKKTVKMLKLQPTAKASCSDLQCGKGECLVQSGRSNTCRCPGGFVAKDCSSDSHVLSLSKGSITFTPTTELRTELELNHSPLITNEFCNGTQSISIDFRTKNSHGIIVALSYEAEFAVIEVHSSKVRYRVFDSYRTPIEITLDSRTVDDGNWHQVALVLSEDRKTITFKIDGIGKEAVSRMVLPSIISTDLKRVQLGINGLRGQFAGCLRRFVVNGYLQTLSMAESTQSTSDEYFTRTISGDISSQCDIGSAQLAIFQTPGVLASIICVCILAIAVLAVFGLAKFVRRHQDTKENSWQQAQEIDAYAMRKPRMISTENGHVNHAMNSSVDSIYATADGYETPIGHAYREHKPHVNTKRIVGDVVLGVRNSSSTDIGRHSFPSKHSYEKPEPPPVPQRMYRNM